MDSNLEQTGIVVITALPAVTWNGVTERWVQVVTVFRKHVLNYPWILKFLASFHYHHTLPASLDYVAGQAEFESKDCHPRWKSEWLLSLCVITIFVGMEL